MDIQFHSRFRLKKQPNIRTVSKYKLPSGKGEDLTGSGIPKQDQVC